MPLLSLSDLSSSTEQQYKQQSFDFIIVGAGSAGCPLASRLSEDPSITVLLIEAGHSRSLQQPQRSSPSSPASLETRINCAIPAGAGKTQHTTLDWEYYAESQLPRACQGLNTFDGAPVGLAGCSYWPRGKGLGGSSLLNYMAWVRGHADDYNLWERHFECPGWGWESSISKLFQGRIENTDECDPSKLCPKCRRCSDNNSNSNSNNNKGPYGISHKTPPNSLATTFVEACESLGHEQGDYNCFCGQRSSDSNDDSSTNNAVGVVGLHQFSVRQGTRCDASRAYLDPILLGSAARQRPNLFVLTGAKCQKVLLEPSKQQSSTGNSNAVVNSHKAVGVQLIPDDDTGNDDLKPTLLYCEKEILLSAGALGSPQILLQSGIGPASSSLIQSPQVGRNLQDHAVCFLRYSPRLGQGNQNIGTVNAYKAEGWKTAGAHLYRMLFQSKGMLTSAAYDASMFYASGIPLGGGSEKQHLMPAWSKNRPDLQIGALVTGGDLQVLQENIGLDFGPMEMHASEVESNAEGMVFCCTLLHPASRGSVELSATNDEKKNDKQNRKNNNNNNGLVIHANYFTDKGNQDMQRIVAGLRMAIRIAQSGPYQDLLAKTPLWPVDLCDKYKVPLNDKKHYFSADDYPEAFLEEYVRRYATTLYHPTSTCRMGRNSKEAVVDARLRVYGVENLRVVDASIQPTIVSGNTQASCVVIGEKAVDILREDHKLKGNPHDLLQAADEYEASIATRRRRLLVAGVAGIVSIAMISIFAVDSSRASPSKMQDRKSVV